MNPKPIEQAKSPLLARTLPALLRARKRAEELAAATNTSLVEVVGGKVVHVRHHRPSALQSRVPHSLHEQRISFAFGNAPESSHITKESVRTASRHIRLKP